MTDPTKNMPNSHVATQYEIAVATHKNIPLHRIALAPVSADVELTIRVVFVNGNTASGTDTMSEAMTLGAAIDSIVSDLGLEGGTNEWNAVHWVSLVGNNPFYFNGGADATGATVSVTPGADDWAVTALTEVRLP